MPDAPIEALPHENWPRKWSAAHSSPRREYRAFRTLAEAREQPDAVAVLDLDGDPHDPLATFPARRVEADPAALERLHADLGALLAHVMAPETPALEGCIRYETAEALDLCDEASRLGGVVLHQGLRPFGLESDVEAVLLGVKEGLGPEARRRVDLLLAWRRAVAGGDVDTVRELIDRGVPVEVACRYGYSALAEADRAGNVAMVRLLLERGADPNRPHGGKSWTPTTGAAARASRRGVGSDDEILRLLIEAGGRLGLREAVILGDVELARSILDADPTIDVSGDAGVWYGYPFLMVAASFGQSEMARFLIDRGADVHGTDHEYHTALGVAAGSGRADIAALLLDRGADPNHVDSTRFTPLADAAYGDHADVVRLLVERGARPTLTDAILLNDARLVAELLPTVEKKGVGLNSVLFHCGRHLARRDLDLVRVLLSGWTEGGGTLGPGILCEAAGEGRLDVVQLLLEYGCDPGEPDHSRGTPAEHAERAGHAEVAEFLRAAAREHRA